MTVLRRPSVFHRFVIGGDVTSQILSPIVQSCQMDQNEERNKKNSCGRNFNPATGGVPPPPNPNFWKFSSISKHRHVTPHWKGNFMLFQKIKIILIKNTQVLSIWWFFVVYFDFFPVFFIIKFQKFLFGFKQVCLLGSYILSTFHTLKNVQWPY